MADSYEQDTPIKSHAKMTHQQRLHIQSSKGGNTNRIVISDLDDIDPNLVSCKREIPCLVEKVVSSFNYFVATDRMVYKYVTLVAIVGRIQRTH